jgi:hypothetical protein
MDIKVVLIVSSSGRFYLSSSSLQETPVKAIKLADKELNMWLYKHESVILTFLPHLVSCIRKAYENS